MSAAAAAEPLPSLGKWVRADCAPRSGVYCWYREHDPAREHWEWKACQEGCDQPAEYCLPHQWCERCWKAWFTEGWEN